MGSASVVRSSGWWEDWGGGGVLGLDHELGSRDISGRDFFGRGEWEGERARFSGRDWRLLSEVADVDMRRES